jgi:hypothetical protein
VGWYMWLLVGSQCLHLYPIWKWGLATLQLQCFCVQIAFYHRSHVVTLFIQLTKKEEDTDTSRALNMWLLVNLKTLFTWSKLITYSQLCSTILYIESVGYILVSNTTMTLVIIYNHFYLFKLLSLFIIYYSTVLSNIRVSSLLGCNYQRV